MRPICLESSLEEWGGGGRILHTLRVSIFLSCPLFPTSNWYPLPLSAHPVLVLVLGDRGRHIQGEGPWHQLSFLLSGQQSQKAPRAGLGGEPVQPRCLPYCVGHLSTVQWLLPSHRWPSEEFHPINSYTSPWQHRLPTLPKIGDRSTDTKGA